MDQTLCTTNMCQLLHYIKNKQTNKGRLLPCTSEGALGFIKRAFILQSFLVILRRPLFSSVANTDHWLVTTLTCLPRDLTTTSHTFSPTYFCLRYLLILSASKEFFLDFWNICPNFQKQELTCSYRDRSSDGCGCGRGKFFRPEFVVTNKSICC